MSVNPAYFLVLWDPPYYFLFMWPINPVSENYNLITFNSISFIFVSKFNRSNIGSLKMQYITTTNLQQNHPGTPWEHQRLLHHNSSSWADWLGDPSFPHSLATKHTKYTHNNYLVLNLHRTATFQQSYHSMSPLSFKPGFSDIVILLTEYQSFPHLTITTSKSDHKISILEEHLWIGFHFSAGLTKI